MSTKKNKKSKNQLAFEKAVNSKIVACQMASVGKSKSDALSVLSSFRDFITEEFNKVSDKKRSKYEKIVRQKISDLNGGHPKLSGWLTRILDEYEPTIS